MSGSIRRALSGDHARISEIRNSVKENVLSDPSRVTVEDYKWLEQNPGVWVWEEKGKILGFSAADTRDGSIWALFVAPGHERRGIGHALLDKACDVLQRHGHRTAMLTTMPDTRAEGFYHAAGWKVIGTSARGELVFHSILRTDSPRL